MLQSQPMEANYSPLLKGGGIPSSLLYNINKVYLRKHKYILVI